MTDRFSSPGAQDRSPLVGTGALPGGIENIQLTLPGGDKDESLHCEVPVFFWGAKSK
jgi:hypothetical protein